MYKSNEASQVIGYATQACPPQSFFDEMRIRLSNLVGELRGQTSALEHTNDRIFGGGAPAQAGNIKDALCAVGGPHASELNRVIEDLTSAIDHLRVEVGRQSALA